VSQLAQAAEPVAPPAPAAEPAPQPASDTPAVPRRAGWWSRRFGGGE
jgi:ribonuclease E